MSNYTVSLKRVCEVYGETTVEFAFRSYDFENYLDKEQVQEIINAGIFSKAFLSKMIIDHYLFREIAYETPEMFLHFARVKMKEIMRKICAFNLFSFAFL